MITDHVDGLDYQNDNKEQRGRRPVCIHVYPKQGKAINADQNNPGGYDKRIPAVFHIVNGKFLQYCMRSTQSIIHCSLFISAKRLCVIIPHS
jgi:hypothetical protein